ncbi:histone-like nucleoid-structuring protein, partial [Xanthomonas arboricola pv. juglandis]
MTTASLSALAAAKEKLAEEIRKLEEQEAQL